MYEMRATSARSKNESAVASSSSESRFHCQGHSGVSVFGGVGERAREVNLLEDADNPR
jgi:hypothetical protein